MTPLRIKIDAECQAKKVPQHVIEFEMQSQTSGSDAMR